MDKEMFIAEIADIAREYSRYVQDEILVYNDLCQSNASEKLKEAFVRLGAAANKRAGDELVKRAEELWESVCKND